MSGAGAAPPARRLRVFLGAFGEPGHAFPMLALGRALAARGHAVMFETWTRWREHVDAAGLEFQAAPEYPVFPTRERPLKPYEAVVLATAETRPPLARFAPDVVVHDILTLAPALAAELEGVPAATLIPHLHPVGAPGFPPFALGARLPRTRAGSRFWDALAPVVEGGLRLGRRELNETRGKLGLPAQERLHGGLSERLCLVATFPQLEYPRAWPAHVRVVGPVVWEPPFGEVEPPPGEEPLVLVAPSTAQDPQHRLLRAALAGLAREPVRVLAACGRPPQEVGLQIPANARVAPWLAYSRLMPQARLVVSHAGHGTLARALAFGCPVLAVPHSGDMPENAARLDWAGVGVRLPWRLVSPGSVRFAVRRALGDPELRARAHQLAAWAAGHDGPGVAAGLVEELVA